MDGHIEKDQLRSMTVKAMTMSLVSEAVNLGLVVSPITAVKVYPVS